jgi:hypothetical protein
LIISKDTAAKVNRHAKVKGRNTYDSNQSRQYPALYV